MRYYDTSFFFDNDKGGPKASISPEGNWTTIRISENGYYSNPCLTFYLRDEKQFINFKNSVIQAYESYRRAKDAS
jgi:hypothetical protein